MSSDEEFGMNVTLENDWAYCEQALIDVSRTFSKPIQLLPEQLRIALTCGYLLCRIVDTVEDHPSWSGRRRDELFSRFIEVLDGEYSAEVFGQTLSDVDDEGPALRLSRSMPRVMRVFAQQSPRTREATVRWVSEMANGMRLYCRRDRGSVPGAIDTVPDLERYCYFVAGTVGHLITDLFSDFMGASSTPLEHELRARCESFGVGLQLVNILKDVADDFSRQGRCYVPRQLCRAQGLEPEQLFFPEHRVRAHRALAPAFECASRHLDAALEYALLIPAERGQLRLFCLLPLWMALETLVALAGNDALFLPDQPIKISREAVTRITRDCMRYAADDASLREQYAVLAARLHERLRATGLLESRFHSVAGRYAEA
jgi:farnesyl-diphosphate farnesyltransferase